MFKTTADIQKFLPSGAEFEYEKLKIFIDQEATPWLRTYLGKTQLANLLLEYEKPTMSTALRTLLHKVRYPVANYAFNKYIAWGTLSIAKRGIHITIDDKIKVPFEHQVKNLEDATIENAYNGIEELLVFLEENKNDYSDWTGGEAYTYFNELLVRTADDFNTYYEIRKSRRTFLCLRALMAQVEEVVIAAISQDYMDELKQQQMDDDLTDENLKVCKWIKRAIANLTIEKACTHLPVRLSGDGLQLIGTSPSQTLKQLTPAEQNRLGAIQQECGQTGDAFLKKAVDYMYANITSYPTFELSDAYIDPDSDDAAPYDQTDSPVVMF